MILLGISGKKRTGKNTIAALIRKHSKFKVKEYAFADALKREVAKFCGVLPATIDTDKDLYRPLLQAWGVYRRQTCGADYWITQVFKSILAEPPAVAIITDVRFRNEAEAILAIDSQLIRVCRNTGLNDTHISETELDTFSRFNHIIINNGTIADLERDVKELLPKLYV